MTRAALLIGVIVLPCSQTPARDVDAGKPEIISTSVCEIVAHPERFSGKMVRLRAFFSTDGLEHSVLTQHGCTTGIIPYPPPDNEGAEQPGLDALDQAAGTGTGGSTGKSISAVFIGRFIWKPPNRRILELKAVEELRVTFLGKGKGAR